jgi:GT2 family glycosyltransferase
MSDSQTPDTEALAAARRRIEELERVLRDANEKVGRMRSDLHQIHGSHGWKLLTTYYRWRERLLPSGSRTHAVVKTLFHGAKTIRRWVLRKKRGPTPMSGPGYEAWLVAHEPDAAEVGRQRAHVFAHMPRISVLVPVYETPRAFLEEMIESVLSQTYRNWELCLVDGASKAAHVAEVLRTYAARDPRIRMEILPKNLGIAGNSRAAADLATGDYVALLDHDDTLPAFALHEVVRTLNEHSDADFVYSDEDRLDVEGRRCAPHFKPDWSPETLRSHNYICHLLVLKRDLFERVGGFREGFDGSQDYDLALRVSEHARHIVHIPKILYHWRRLATSFSTASLSVAIEAGRKAIADHLSRTGIEGIVLMGETTGTYQVRRSLPREPLVSILIPTRDLQPVLARCLDSLKRSRYTNYEIILVENNSREPATFDYYRSLECWPKVRLVTWQGSFNYAAINNFAAREARGDVFLLLNNDTEVKNVDWMERLLEHALRPEVGAVGAKLFYPDGSVQHAGVIVGLHGFAHHAFRFLPSDAPGYCHRAAITQDLSAVTAACLMMRREVYEEVGGLDERFPVAYNDIDLCLRLRAKGYSIIWTPHAQMVHHESKTRGEEDTRQKKERFAEEGRIFMGRWWREIQAGDPFYNPNLSLDDDGFELRVAPTAERAAA